MAGTVVQVTNISSSVTEKQMRDLFGIFGRVDDLKLYPSNSPAGSTSPRVGYLKFGERDCCLVAQHLTNTVFLDKALIVIPVPVDYLPDEATAMAAAGLDGASSASVQPVIDPTPVQPVVPMTASTAVNVSTAGSVQSLIGINLATIQPVTGVNPIMQCMSPTPVPNQLVTGAQARAALNTPLYQAIAALAPPVSDPPLPGSVPAAPVLGGNVDPTKIEEIRRTVYVGNLNTQLAGEALVPFFEAKCSEVLYVRMAGDETQPTRFVFVEFSKPEAVNLALQYNGAMFGDRPLKVNHSKNAVVKPQVKPQDVAQREVDAAMEQVRKAQMAIMKQIQPEDELPKKSRSPSPRRRSHGRARSRTRSRSPSRDRDRDRDRYRRRDHRDRRHDRRQSRSPRRRRRSRSRSRDRRRSRSRDRDRRRSRRSRSRSYERRRSPSSSPSPDRRSKKHKRRDRDRSRDRDRDRPNRHGSTDAPPPPPPTAADDMYLSD